MKLTSWACAGLLLIAASCIGDLGAAEPRIGKFVKYDTGDFVIVTSRSSSQAREIMENLAKFRLSLEKVLGNLQTVEIAAPKEEEDKPPPPPPKMEVPPPFVPPPEISIEIAPFLTHAHRSP